MHARLLAALGLVTTLALAGCSGSSDGSGPTTRTTSAGRSSAPSTATGSSPISSSPTGATFPSAPVTSGTQYYVSLGDSYAAGYQATARGRGTTTTNGFAYQVVRKAKAKGYRYTLANFGCGGATTASMLSSPGCTSGQYGPGAAHYSSTQTAAAVAFLEAHRGHIALITISIGGNDVIPCGVRTDALTCLTTSVGKVGTNLTSILGKVRAAAGPSTRIVGTTYPDVLLGNLLSKDANLRSLASLSVTAFKSLINPQLQQAYVAAGGRFVDVTTAFGGYGSLTKTISLPPYGRIPVPAAKICTLTFYCQYQDIHPRTTGYAIIADLVVATLPRA